MTQPLLVAAAFGVALPLHAARSFAPPRRSVLLAPRARSALHHASLRLAPRAQPLRHARTPPRASLPTALGNVASTGAGVLVLGFIVFIHECGHFVAARAQNIRVSSFSIGFGPKLLSLTAPRSRVQFTLRLLPLGGFVSFPEHERVGDDGERYVDQDGDLLQNRPLAQRALVISAGVLANMLLAWCALFASVCMLGVPEYSVLPGVSIERIVDANGAAARAGLVAGDVIVSVDGQQLQNNAQSSAQLAQYIRASRGRDMLFDVQRHAQTLRVRARADCCAPDGGALMGVQLNSRVRVSRDAHAPLSRKATAASAELWRVLTHTTSALGGALRGDARASGAQLSGPVGVVSMGAQLAREDAPALLTFCAVISVNVALINALPLPALDGGQMALLALEALRGRALPRALQDAINSTALTLLLALSGALLLGDLQRLHVVATLQRWLS